MSGWLTRVILIGFWGCLFFSFNAAAQISPEDRYFLNSSESADDSKRISIDFKDAPLTEVLKVFSKQSGLNFIAAAEVSSKRVTLFFENIPVREALQKILDANNLAYDLQPDTNIFVVRVKEAQDPVITRIYYLKHASVPSSKIKSTISIADASASSTGTTTSSSSTASGSSSSSASLTEGIYAAVKAILSKSGILVEDPRTNSLIVTDLKSNFPVIENTISKLDKAIPQILIEVEMLDISKITSDLMGVKWGDTPFAFGGASKSTLLPFNQSQYLKKLDTISPVPGSDSSSSSSSSSSSTSESTSPYTAGSLSAAGMTAVLQFLKSRSDTRDLAKPRILTLNNETAQIKISTNEAIGLTTTNFGSTSATTATSEAERVQTGVFLTVTPQADIEANEITLAVSPKVIQARTGATFGNTTFKDPEERGTQSILRIHDGETIMIGGLLRTDDSNTVTKIPILGDLPLVGMAFRHKNKAGSKRELIIFLTPHILQDSRTDPFMVHKKIAKSVPAHTDSKGSHSYEVNKALATMEEQRF
jgi:type IV pilus assembly protein PilQ